MSFEATERIVALNPALIPTLIPALLARYGESLPDGEAEIVTIGGYWDDTEKTRKRAASLADGTIEPTRLTDGRVAFSCLWQTELAAAFEGEQIADAEELSFEEFRALLPEQGDL